MFPCKDTFRLQCSSKVSPAMWLQIQKDNGKKVILLKSIFIPLQWGTLVPNYKTLFFSSLDTTIQPDQKEITFISDLQFVNYTQHGHPLLATRLQHLLNQRAELPETNRPPISEIRLPPTECCQRCRILKGISPMFTTLSDVDQTCNAYKKDNKPKGPSGTEGRDKSLVGHPGSHRSTPATKPYHLLPLPQRAFFLPLLTNPQTPSWQAG